ncbi:MAG: glycosyltransferase family 4 protein [Geminicoccaceae bacterium]
MKKKRTGIPFTGERVGGSHVSTLLLLEGLDPMVFEPVILVHSDGPVAEFLRGRSVDFNIEPLPAIESWKGSGFRRFLASFSALFPVMRLIRKHELDLIHIQDHKAFQLWVWGALFARRPLILHWRGPYRKTLITRGMMRFATSIVVISRYLREKLPDEIGRRAKLIYNPFDTRQSPPDRTKARTELRAELGLADDAVVLGWIGTIDQRKHPEQFIDIVTALAEERAAPPIHGVLCGGPGTFSDDPAWTGALERGGNLVHQLGFRDPITPILRGCDALVVTAANEPFGRTVIEAMLAEVPVVAAADGGYVEVMEHGKTGLLVPPGDRQAFVEAIVSLLDNPKMTGDLVQQAQAVAVDRFSIDRHVGAIETVYKSLLAKSAKIEEWATE